MRKSVLLVIGAAMLGAGLSGGPVRALAIDVKPYIGAVGDLTVLCPANQGAPSAMGIGGNCFSLSAADETIVVRVDDDYNAPAGFQVGFFTTTGGRIGAFRPGCVEGTFDVPPLAVQARVFVDGPINGPIDCAGIAEDGPLAGVGIAGSVGLVRLP